MKTAVSALAFPLSIGVYGRGPGSGAAELNISGRVDEYHGLVWGRVDSAGAGLEPGFYCVRVRAKAVIKTGWWASIELYAVDGSLDSAASAKGTSNRHFTDLGEFEGAADFETATRLQQLLEASRRERGETP
jgi:hypothetical protein